MATFFLDIVSEEIPAHLQDWEMFTQSFKSCLEKSLEKAPKKVGLSPSDGGKPEVEVFVTPRRLAALVKNLKAKGLKNVDDCPLIEGSKQKSSAKKVDSTSELLDILARVIRGISFKFSWHEEISCPDRGDGLFSHWVRPIRGICAVLDKKPIKGFSAYTYADPIPHKEGMVKITDANKAVKILERAKVFLHTGERRKRIEKAIGKAPHDLTPDEKSFVLRGVSRSEHPHVCEEELHRSYMEDLPLPLVKSVVWGQECLLADKGSGKFFIVSDSEPNARIGAGFKNVIEAKLDDARYFLGRDQQRRLEEFLPLLKNITYHEELGSVWHRAKRLEKLSRFVASKLAATNGEAQELAAVAGLLAKADLATEIVKEFPNLQGTMGGYYLSKQQDDKKFIAYAIRNHYIDTASSDLPKSPSRIEYHGGLGFREDDTGRIVYLALVIAERADHLAGLWLCGERPTSSRDPFGMGNSARILYQSSSITIDDKRLPSLSQEVLKKAVELNRKDWQEFNEGGTPKGYEGSEQTFREICEFILQKGLFHAVFADKIKPRLIAAVKGVVSPSDFATCDSRLYQLGRFYLGAKAKLEAIVATATRVENILRPHLKVEKSPKFDEQKLQQPEEKKLYEIYKKVDDNIASQIKESSVDFDFGIFTEEHAPLADFFDKVTVNCDDKALRDNRLALLLKVRACYRRFADFTKLRTG